MTMPAEPHVNASGEQPPLDSSIEPVWRWSWPSRVAFLFTGVVVPVICFALGPPLPPDWQSGQLQDYAKLLLDHKPACAFYPLLLYSMICMTLMVFWPSRFSTRFVVRLGIYSGVLLAVQYWLVVLASLGDSADPFSVPVFLFWSVLAVMIPWAIGAGLVSVVRAGGKSSFALLGSLACLMLVLMFLVVVIEGTGPLVDDVLAPVLGILLILCLICATPWAVASYGFMAFSLLRRRPAAERWQFSLAQLLGVSTWLAVYFSAWRTSILWMLEEYSKLPATPPDDCYVCTAAARGHRRFVRSEQYTTPDGKTYCVNDQMRYLKAAEVMLAAGSPRVHRFCRRMYDRLGPGLAAMLAHPLPADVAYLSLKPFEWSFRAILKWLSTDEELIRKLYRPLECDDLSSLSFSICRLSPPRTSARRFRQSDARKKKESGDESPHSI